MKDFPVKSNQRQTCVTYYPHDRSVNAQRRQRNDKADQVVSSKSPIASERRRQHRHQPYDADAPNQQPEVALVPAWILVPHTR